MITVKLVQAKKQTVLQPRTGSITASKRNSDDKTIYLTRNSYAAEKFYSIGLASTLDVDYGVRLHYEFMKPPYSGLLEFYQERATILASQLAELSTQADSSYEVTNRDFATTPLTRPGADFIKAQQASVASAISEIQSWQSAHSETFGYGVMLTVETGDLSPDISTIRVLSSADGLLMSITVANQTLPNSKVPSAVYSIRDRRGIIDFPTQTIFEQNVTNKNYLSDDSFMVLNSVRRPNVLYWVEVGDMFGNLFTADMKFLQVYGTIHGRVVGVETQINEAGDEFEAVLVEDDLGLQYTSKNPDFTAVSVGDDVIITKNKCSIVYPDDPEKGVEVIDSEGVCGAVKVGRQGSPRSVLSVRYYDGAIATVTESTVNAALAQSYAREGYFSSLAASSLSAMKTVSGATIIVLVPSSISSPDAMGGGVLESGNVVIVTSAADRFLIAAEAAKLIYRKYISASKRLEWSGSVVSELGDMYSTYSVEDRFAQAYAGWILNTYGTEFEAVGTLNSWFAHLFFDDLENGSTSNYSVIGVNL